MPDGVKVNVTDVSIISALNTPGGAVYEWRDETMKLIVARAFATSPVNDPLNAMHRSGRVGEYQQSWRPSRAGSNGHRVRALIRNVSDHAVFVEFGRGPSHGVNAFTASDSPGDVIVIGYQGRPLTSGWPGKHVLRNAVNAVMPGQTGGAYTPLA